MSIGNNMEDLSISPVFTNILRYLSLADLARCLQVSRSWYNVLSNAYWLWCSQDLCVGLPSSAADKREISPTAFKRYLEFALRGNPNRLIYRIALALTHGNRLEIKQLVGYIRYCSINILSLHFLAVPLFKIITNDSAAFQNVSHLVIQDDYFRPQATVACLHRLPRLQSFHLGTHNLPIGHTGMMEYTSCPGDLSLSLRELFIVTESIGSSPLLFLHHLTSPFMADLTCLVMSFPSDGCEYYYMNDDVHNNAIRDPGTGTTANANRVIAWSWLRNLQQLRILRISIRQACHMDIIHQLNCPKLEVLLLSIDDPTPQFHYSYRQIATEQQTFTHLRCIYLISPGLGYQSDADIFLHCKFGTNLETVVSDEDNINVRSLVDVCLASPKLGVVQILPSYGPEIDISNLKKILTKSIDKQVIWIPYSDGIINSTIVNNNSANNTRKLFLYTRPIVASSSKCIIG